MQLLPSTTPGHSRMTAILIAILVLYLPSVVTTQENSSCISNYAQLKESLFEESSGNVERLLYAFKPPNRPTPHYIWVYYFHNQSTNWNDVLTCPQTSVLQRCPIINDSAVPGGVGIISDENEINDIIFWADSPLLINVDITLLKAYTLDILFGYLGNGLCVQLAIAPFCPTVDSETRSRLLQFATTVIRSYSTSNEENVRDYILACRDKSSTESVYDLYILSSELIIGFGSLVLYIVLCIKWSQIGEAIDFRKLCDLKHYCSCSTQDHVKSSPNVSFRHSKMDSMLLVVNASTAFILIVDFVQVSISFTQLREVLFKYHYSALNAVLFMFTGVVFGLAIFVGFPAYVILEFCGKWNNSVTYKTKFHWRCENLRHFFYTSITAVSFVFVVIRVYMISLVLTSYPFEVGFIVASIGLAYVAVIFVILIIINLIPTDTVGIKFIIHDQAKFRNIVILLILSICLLAILCGFMLSYIAMVLRLNIRSTDPLMALVAALIPTAVGFIVANRFNTVKKSINKSIQPRFEAKSSPASKFPVEDVQGSESTLAFNQRDSQKKSVTDFPLETVAAIQTSRLKFSQVDIQETEL